MLPESAREELRRAAQTPIDLDPIARAKAISKVTDRLRYLHPECFKEVADEPTCEDSHGQRCRDENR